MLAERIGSSQLAEMSAQGASVATTLCPDDLPRLAALVGRDADQRDGTLSVRVRFSTGPESFPIVQVRVTGTVELTCQRCLAPVSWPLDLEVSLTVVGSDAEADALADPFDSVMLDEEGGLRLRTAVEDEILAVLPLVPLHGEGAPCKMFAEKASAAAPAVTVNRPFAGLDALMRRDAEGERDT